MALSSSEKERDDAALAAIQNHIAHPLFKVEFLVKGEGTGMQVTPRLVLYLIGYPVEPGNGAEITRAIVRRGYKRQGAAPRNGRGT
jgi:hypothetical protein